MLRKREELSRLTQKVAEIQDALQREGASLGMIKCQTDSQGLCLALLDSRIVEMEKELPSLRTVGMRRHFVESTGDLPVPGDSGS